MKILNAAIQTKRLPAVSRKTVQCKVLFFRKNILTKIVLDNRMGAAAFFSIRAQHSVASYIFAIKF